MAARALVVDDEATPLAVVIGAVRAVVAGPELTLVPTAPPSVLGLANVRGDVVPVFDAARLLGREPVREPRFVLVVDTALGPAGLAVAAMPLTADVEDGDERLVDVDALVAGAG